MSIITPLHSILTFTPLSVNRFSNKLPPNAPNNMLKNPLFYFFGSFIIVLLRPCINNPDSSGDLIKFIISSNSSFEMISAFIPDPNIFVLITASVVDTAAVICKGIKAISASGLSRFFY